MQLIIHVQKLNAGLYASDWGYGGLVVQLELELELIYFT